MELVHGAVDRPIEGVRVVGDADRGLPASAGLEHAPHVGAGRPTGALVAEVDLDPHPPVLELRQSHVDLDLDPGYGYRAPVDVVVGVDGDLQGGTP